MKEKKTFTVEIQVERIESRKVSIEQDVTDAVHLLTSNQGTHDRNFE